MAITLPEVSTTHWQVPQLSTTELKFEETLLPDALPGTSTESGSPLVTDEVMYSLLCNGSASFTRKILGWTLAAVSTVLFVVITHYQHHHHGCGFTRRNRASG